MAYPNLAAEMARYGISQAQIADAVGKRPETVSRWMLGKSDMPMEKMFIIRDTFFPSMNIEYLADPSPFEMSTVGVA